MEKLHKKYMCKGNKQCRHCEGRSNLIGKIKIVDCFVPRNDVWSRNILCFVFLASFTLFSCKKDKPSEKENTVVNINQNGVYIINEGNFNIGNGSVSYFSPSDSSISEDLFKTQNNKALGDVCQSLTFFNQKGYVVVNNSQKVEVVDQNTFKSLATISGLTSPRYFLPVSNSKAYISDLYANKITLVDMSNNSISGYITCPKWTEEMAMVYGKVFVCSPHSDKVFVIQSSSDQVIDSITVSYGSSSIQEDKNGKLWVICSGDEAKNIAGAIHLINPISQNVEKSFVFSDVKLRPKKLDFNPNKDSLYFLNQGVCSMSILDNSLPNMKLIPESGKNFYGIGVHPISGEIYVSDAIDYLQKSTIYRYTSNGKLIQSFKAGNISGNFAF